MRRIENQPHQATSHSSRNRDSHDPTQAKEEDTLPVHRAEGSVAETDTDSGTGDAHGRRHRQLVLREDEHRDGGAEFHRAASAGGVVGDFVTHDYSNQYISLRG